MSPSRFVLYSAFLAAISLQSPAGASDVVPEVLRGLGVSQEAYLSMVRDSLVSPVLRSGGPDCLHSDELTFQDKAILAETVVRGRIAEVTYLYHQGGPYRTLYRIEVAEGMKGGAIKEVGVLSKYGPTRRDHRRWRHNPSRIVLKAGDEGVFFLTGKVIRERMDMVPAQAKDFVSDKVHFLNEIHGVYMTKGPHLDSGFLAKTRKKERSLDLAQIRSALAKVRQATGGDKR